MYVCICVCVYISPRWRGATRGIASPLVRHCRASQAPNRDIRGSELRYSYPYPCPQKSSTNFLLYPFVVLSMFYKLAWAWAWV